MKILHLLHYPHKFGGLESFINSLINNEKENEHSILFFGKDKGFRLDIPESIETYHIRSLTETVNICENKNIDILHIHWTGPESHNGKGVLCFLPNGQTTIILNSDCELDIDSNPFGVTQIPGLFKQGTKPKVIVTCHTEFKLPESVFYDQVVSVSNKAYNSQDLKYKHSVIYNGVDSNIFYPSDRQGLNKRNSEGKLKVVWSGRLEKFNKEVYDLIKTDKDINDIYDFYYYGSGGLDNDPLPNHYFMGSIDNSEMPNILRNADIFLYPTNIDSFGLALVEAMLTGLPVLGSEVIAEILESFPESGRSYLSMLETLKDSDFRYLYGSKGRQKALNLFTLDKMISSYQELYKK